MPEVYHSGTRDTQHVTIEEIINMMVGRELAARPAKLQSEPGETLLSVEGLCTAKVENISFQLHRGEVLGIAGLVGAGRRELGAALFAWHRIKAGQIQMNDAIFCRNRRRRSGIQAAVQRRCRFWKTPHKTASWKDWLQMSVRENSTMAALARFQHLGNCQPIHRDS